MGEYDKFKIDYSSAFARQINDIHVLCKEVFKTRISDGDLVLDIGGGPGIGARLIDELGTGAVVVNIEPSESANDIPVLKHVTYSVHKSTIKDFLSLGMDCKADCIVLMSSAHEIALGYGNEPKENKRLFALDLKNFVRKFLKESGLVIMGFPGYVKGVTDEQVKRQREYNDRLLGHSHALDEYVYLEDFIPTFPDGPVFLSVKPMSLADQEKEQSVLTATAAVYNFPEQ